MQRLRGEASRLDVEHMVIHLDGVAHRGGGNGAAHLVGECPGAPPTLGPRSRAAVTAAKPKLRLICFIDVSPTKPFDA